MGNKTFKEKAQDVGRSLLTALYLLPYLVNGEEIPVIDDEKLNAAHVSIQESLKRARANANFVAIENEDGKIEIRRRNGAAIMKIENNEVTQEFFPELVPIAKYRAEHEMYRYENIVVFGEKFKAKYNEKTNQIEELQKFSVEAENDYRAICGRDELIEFLYTITGGKLEEIDFNNGDHEIRLIDTETSKFIQGSPKHVLAEALVSMGMDKSEVYAMFDIQEGLEESDEQVIAIEESEVNLCIDEEEAKECLVKVKNGFKVEDPKALMKYVSVLESRTMRDAIIDEVQNILDGETNGIIDELLKGDEKAILKNLYEIFEFGKDEPEKYMKKIEKKILKSKLRVLYPDKDSYSEEEIEFAMQMTDEEYNEKVSERTEELIGDFLNTSDELEKEHKRVAKSVQENAEYLGRNANANTILFKTSKELESRQRGIVSEIQTLDEGIALMKTVNIYYILAEKIIEAEESREEGEKKQTESDIEYDKVVDKKQIDGQIGWDGELWSEVDNGQSWKKDKPKVNQTASNMDGYFYEESQAEETVSSKEMENIEAPNVITGIEEDANGQYAFDFGYGEINEKAPELE